MVKQRKGRRCIPASIVANINQLTNTVRLMLSIKQPVYGGKEWGPPWLNVKSIGAGVEWNISVHSTDFRNWFIK